MEEAAIHASVVELPHGAGVAVRQDRFGAEFVRGGLETRGDFIEGFVPGNAGETAFAFCADAAEGVQKAIGRVFVFEVAGYFGAEEASGDGMGGVASEAAAVTLFIDIDEEGAGVGAIEGEDGVDGGGTVIQLSPMDPKGNDFRRFEKTKPIFRVVSVLRIFSTLILWPCCIRKTSSRLGGSVS
jgi:hypothetical protein